MARMARSIMPPILKNSSLPFSSVMGPVLCAHSEMTSTRNLGNVEDIYFEISILILHVVIRGEEFLIPFFEFIGDVFQENQTQDNMLILSRIHVPAQNIGCGPDLLLKAQARRVVSVI
jgi:hypothetical protein